ncbi:hypothetical protein GE09DRAFT_1077880 [Coniochaeta sp. 2T2.1]|nr:hypothetical protein GE09DRAFT_1077880 [Coniochaeta sp. 2T2.1]
MNRNRFFEHDCARCEHSPAFGLEYVDDPQVGTPSQTRSLRGTPATSHTFLPWRPSTSRHTKDSVAIEHIPIALYHIGQRIITLHTRLLEEDQERLVLEWELSNNKTELNRLRDIMLGQLLCHNGALGSRPEQKLEKETVDEAEGMIARVNHLETSLLDAKDRETKTLDEIHEQRLRRGCTCCNETIREVNEIMDQTHDLWDGYNE